MPEGNSTQESNTPLPTTTPVPISSLNPVLNDIKPVKFNYIIIGLLGLMFVVICIGAILYFTQSSKGRQSTQIANNPSPTLASEGTPAQLLSLVNITQSASSDAVLLKPATSSANTSANTGLTWQYAGLNNTLTDVYLVSRVVAADNFNPIAKESIQNVLKDYTNQSFLILKVSVKNTSTKGAGTCFDNYHMYRLKLADSFIAPVPIWTGNNCYFPLTGGTSYVYLPVDKKQTDFEIWLGDLQYPNILKYKLPSGTVDHNSTFIIKTSVP